MTTSTRSPSRACGESREGSRALGTDSAARPPGGHCRRSNRAPATPPQLAPRPEAETPSRRTHDGDPVAMRGAAARSAGRRMRFTWLIFVAGVAGDCAGFRPPCAGEAGYVPGHWAVHTRPPLALASLLPQAWCPRAPVGPLRQHEKLPRHVICLTLGPFPTTKETGILLQEDSSARAIPAAVERMTTMADDA